MGSQSYTKRGILSQLALTHLALCITWPDDTRVVNIVFNLVVQCFPYILISLVPNHFFQCHRGCFNKMSE